MDTRDERQKVSAGGPSWRRRLVALGAAAAIGLGGIAFVTPAEAQEAGVQRPVLVAVVPSQPAVSDEGSASPKDDD